MARLPKWTRCQSVGMPSTAMYWSMGETTTRFSSVIPRKRNGRNIGGGGLARSTSNPCAFTFCANQFVTSLRNFSSRNRTFS